MYIYFSFYAYICTCSRVYIYMHKTIEFVPLRKKLKTLWNLMRIRKKTRTKITTFAWLTLVRAYPIITVISSLPPFRRFSPSLLVLSNWPDRRPVEYRFLRTPKTIRRSRNSRYPFIITAAVHVTIPPRVAKIAKPRAVRLHVYCLYLSLPVKEKIGAGNLKRFFLVQNCRAAVSPN